MKNSDQASDLEIVILPSTDAERINASEWEELAQNSLYHNPFYQRWNLLPALRHLTLDNDIYIILIKHNEKLVGLFPVIMSRFHNTIKYLSMWAHDHCYLTDPLLLKDIDFRKIINRTGKKLGANWFQSALHTPQLMPKKYGLYQYKFSRAVITDTTKISKNLDSMRGKARREIRRVNKKIIRDLHIRHIEHQDITLGLARYCDLEHKGWKGRKGGSILSNKDVEDYYFGIAHNSGTKHHIIFHELWTDNHLIAISIRFKIDNYWYDVKTCYDEKYKQYSPGKVLELRNLALLESQSFRILDSCTRPDNALINKLWPEQLPLQSSHVFFSHLKSQCWHLAYLIKKLISKIKSLAHKQ